MVMVVVRRGSWGDGGLTIFICPCKFLLALFFFFLMSTASVVVVVVLSLPSWPLLALLLHRIAIVVHNVLLLMFRCRSTIPNSPRCSDECDIARVKQCWLSMDSISQPVLPQPSPS